MKDYHKKKQSPYLKWWDVNNLYDLAMLQNYLKAILSGLKMFVNLMEIL